MEFFLALYKLNNQSINQSINPFYVTILDYSLLREYRLFSVMAVDYILLKEYRLSVTVFYCENNIYYSWTIL
jgi:hypothetical protein